jgi:uncharacterized protein (DUF169 family)
MVTLSQLEQSLRTTLRPTRRPVAIAFAAAAPAGVPRLDGSQPSGCSFWRLAAEGRTFYTTPEDHYNCPIGSYTHNIPLPAAREHELGDTLKLMGEIGYIRMEEVPLIPRLPTTPNVTVYAPLSESPVEPDAVVVCGRPGRLMLLHEAAARTGKPSRPLLGRPTCMAVPAVMEGGLASSLGCIGNRVYTGLSEDELYAMIAGRDLADIVEALETIAAANAALESYHTARRAELTTA